MIRVQRWIVVSSVCCALSSTGIAQDSQQRSKPDEKSMGSPAQSEKAGRAGTHANNQQQLSGKVKESRQTRVGTSKGSQNNRVVLLETNDGKTLAVDLGPNTGLKDVEIKRGTPLQVSGVVVNVEGNPVFMAQSFTIGKKSVTARRSSPDESRRPQSQSFAGTIAKTKEMGIKGTDKKHQVAVLETAHDKKLLVDLGPTEQLDKLEIESGDKVRVQGYGTNINQRRVLVAQVVEKDGKSTQIEREALPKSIDLKKGESK